jgi:uncharacterized protein
MRGKFIGRGQELGVLDGWVRRVAESGAGMLVAIRGRRQAGKSRLAEHFAASSGIPYGVAEGMLAAPAEVQVRRAGAALRSSEHPLPGIEAVTAYSGGDWYDLLERLTIVLRGGTAILVLDEFPWAVQSCPGLDSLLQSLWDKELSRRPVLVVLIGSDDAMMNRLFAHDQPLFGRVDDQLVVNPFNPAEVALALGRVSNPMEVFDTVLVTGGFPELVADAARFESVSALAEHTLFRAHSPLADIAAINLAGELADSAAARRVLEAIGADEVGVLNFSRIAATLGGGKTAETTVTRATAILLEKGIIAVDEPAGDPRPRLRRYRIADPYLRFWFRFIEPQLRNIQMGRPDMAVNEFRGGWSPWRGKAIEPVVREALLRLAPRLPDPYQAIESVGGWWSRGGSSEFDIVATGHKHLPVAIGSIKWRERKRFSETDLRELAMARASVPHAERAPLIAVTPAGVAKDVRPDLVLGAADLLAAWG